MPDAPKTEGLIERLSQDTAPIRRLSPPRVYQRWVLAALAVYALLAALVLGLRPDIVIQLSRPVFLLEVLLLLALVISSARQAVWALYPDRLVSPIVPFCVLAALVVLLALEAWLFPGNPEAPLLEPHGIECLLCIAGIAVLPALALFCILRRGSTVRPSLAGALAVLAAAGVGCLTLRLAEPNDAMAHLLLWHYLPTFLFTSLGVLAGKFFLRW